MTQQARQITQTDIIILTQMFIAQWYILRNQQSLNQADHNQQTGQY
jgi:hypothetical protein